MAASVEQAFGADGVAARLVRKPDAELRQPLPELGFGAGPGPPSGFQHFVCGERAAGVNEIARDPDRLLGGQRVFGHWRHAG